MKKRNFIAVSCALALLSGCIPSLNPFYTEKDVVFDSHLVGEWQGQENPDDKEMQTWKFEDAGNQAYKLSITEKDGKEGSFEAHLFQVKGERFLDLLPASCEFADKQAGLVNVAMFRGHLLARVPQLGAKLQLAFMDYDWFGNYLKENPKALAHHKEGDSIVLTASPRELQEFVLKHLGKGELFGEPGELARK
jgi:hypothetical protein